MVVLHETEKTRRDILVKPMTEAKGSGLLLRFAIDHDHLWVFDLKDSWAQSVMESCKPVREGALDSQVGRNLGRGCVSQGLVALNPSLD